MGYVTTAATVFPRVKRRQVEALFNGGQITSDAGMLLVRATDRLIGLTRRAARLLADPRRSSSCRHSRHDLLRQRVYGIVAGYEDLNDHTSMRNDLALQTAVERESALASAPTLSRFENRADRATAVLLSELMVETFIESFSSAPRELVLDFDPTDDIVHGQQCGRFFHAYYRDYCFLPLYVFCGTQLLVSYLRPSNRDGARHAWAILALLVKRFRQQWPGVRIVFRADSGFCRRRMLRWCESHGVDYLVGIATNPRLARLCTRTVAKVRTHSRRTGGKVKRYLDVYYAAREWKRRRRVIVKAEHNAQGANTRFVITNMKGQARALYEQLYCARGDMENRIKEQQLYLFADRTSCHQWWANQFRLLLSSLAYILLDTMRRVALAGTQLAQAQCHTIRATLIRIGAVVVRNSRRVRFLLPRACPYRELFRHVAWRLAAG